MTGETELSLREIAQRLAAHANRRVENFDEIRELAAALHGVANDLLPYIDSVAEPR